MLSRLGTCEASRQRATPRTEVPRWLERSLGRRPILDVGSETYTKDCYVRSVVWLINPKLHSMPGYLCADITESLYADGVSWMTTRIYFGSGTMTSSYFLVRRRSSLTSSFIYISTYFGNVRG